MARTDPRGGLQTRTRIAEGAARLLIERGLDAATVAEVAREAGVSTVTVVNHFPRQKGLHLDRPAEAELVKPARWLLAAEALMAKKADQRARFASMFDVLSSGLVAKA